MAKKISRTKKFVKNIDGGAPTQSNYQFQYACGSIIAINMYTKKFNFKELFCEIFEDVLGIKQNNHVVGIQIKFRDSKYGPFQIKNEAVVKTIKRFVFLNEEFPKDCDKFIFMSNMPIVLPNKHPFEDLIVKCKGKKLSEGEEKIVKSLEKKSGLKFNQILKVLKKLEFQIVPDKDHIQDTIINKHLSTVKECKPLHNSELNEIVNSLKNMVEKKSTLIKDSLTLYASFLDNVDKDNQIVNSKRITSEDVKNCIIKRSKLLYLDHHPPQKLSIGSYGLIDRKMNLGKINSSEIENVKILTHSAENYFLEQYYEEEESEKIFKILDDVEKKIHTIQAECETKAEKEGKLMGVKKLELIEERLHDELKDDPSKFHELQYGHLKGVLGIMMTNCKVPFSKKPKGGWI